MVKTANRWRFEINSRCKIANKGEKKQLQILLVCFFPGEARLSARLSLSSLLVLVSQPGKTDDDTLLFYVFFLTEPFVTGAALSEGKKKKTAATITVRRRRRKQAVLGRLTAGFSFFFFFGLTSLFFFSLSVSLAHN